MLSLIFYVCYQGGTVKNLFTALLALFIVLVFTCGSVLSLDKSNAKSTRLPVSAEAKDRAALEEQTKQKQREAETQMKNANSTTDGNTSSINKKRNTRNQTPPSQGLPKD